MNQILVTVYFHTQNEHKYIKKVANCHVRVILKRYENAEKFMFFLFSL